MHIDEIDQTSQHICIKKDVEAVLDHLIICSLILRRYPDSNIRDLIHKAISKIEASHEIAVKH